MKQHSDNRLIAFPYIGGKWRVADEVWKRFGRVKTYVEPFGGSLAVYLSCPYPEALRAAVLNDLDCMIVNFWRAVRAEPDKVAYHAYHISSLADFIARNNYLAKQRADGFRERMFQDPEFYDVKSAGWWVWGQCLLIGASIGGYGSAKFHTKQPDLTMLRGIKVFRRQEDVVRFMERLSHRLEPARVLCGDWSRCVERAGDEKLAPVGVFLDPPYDKSLRCVGIYMSDKSDNEPGPAVYDWCMKNGNDPDVRIALCGYEGEYDMPDSWEVYKWSSGGGWGTMAKSPNVRSQSNRFKERIWFSPSCRRLF